MSRKSLAARAWPVAVVILTALAALSGPLWVAGRAAADPPAASTSAAAQGGISYAKTLSLAFREAARKVLPSVVLIVNLSAPEPAANPGSNLARPSPALPDGLLPNPDPRPPQGMMGSGVIVDPSGFILTNHHVVERDGKTVVRLHDGREFEAVEIKRDRKTELALVRIKAPEPLPAAKFGNSDEMQVGDWVLALGNPFGLEGTVSMGIVSAKGRGLGGRRLFIAMREDFIQTDAPINPGNSGGPLINLDGEIIGINTAIKSTDGGTQPLPGSPPAHTNFGIGFAIPSNLAKWVSQELIAHAAVRRAYLGVVIKAVTPEMTPRTGVAAGKGVWVDDIQHNAPAAGTGLKSGDVIVEFSGKPVRSPEELQYVVEQAPIGRPAALTFVRHSKRMTINVTVREQPANYGLAMLPQAPPSRSPAAQPSPAVARRRETFHQDQLGIDVADITDDATKQAGFRPGEGVVITDVRANSPAALANLKPGMVVLQARRKPVRSVDDFRTAMSDQPNSGNVSLLILTPERATSFVVIKLSQ